MAEEAKMQIEFIRDRVGRMSKGVLAALLRIARRIEEGFEGEITISIKKGGVAHIRWAHTETGDVIKEELV